MIGWLDNFGIAVRDLPGMMRFRYRGFSDPEGNMLYLAERPM